MFAGLLLLHAALAGDPVLDLGQSVVVADTPRLSMGGAGIALAAGSAGLALTPAAAEHRPAHRREYKAWDLHARIARYGWIGSDTNNLGDSRQAWLAGHWAAGAGVSTPRAGIALLARGFTAFSLPDRDDRRTDVGDLRLGGGVRVLGTPLTLGAGATLAAGRLRGDEELFFLAPGVSFGFLADWADIGLHVAGVVESSMRDGNVGPASGVQSVVVPARGAVGVAWASEAMSTPLDRHPLLLAADLEITSTVADGIEPQAWMLGEHRPSGRSASISPHFGLEVEAVPDMLRLRAGTYLDAARADGSVARWHGTGGVELRTLSIRLRGERVPLALRNGFDLSERYAQVQLLGLTFWRPYRVSTGPPG